MLASLPPWRDCREASLTLAAFHGGNASMAGSAAPVKGNDFHTRRVLRISLLVTYLGVAVALWAGIVSALGRGASAAVRRAGVSLSWARCAVLPHHAAYHSEAFDPSAAFQVQVAGCDVVVRPGLESCVELRRWRAAGVTHRCVVLKCSSGSGCCRRLPVHRWTAHGSRHALHSLRFCTGFGTLQAAQARTTWTSAMRRAAA